MIVNNFLHSARILGDGCERFRLFSLERPRLNENRIAPYVEDNVMLLTALSPVIGYEKSDRIAQRAVHDDSTLKEAALKSGDVDEATYDRVVDPRSMVGHGVGGA